MKMQKKIGKNNWSPFSPSLIPSQLQWKAGGACGSATHKTTMAQLFVDIESVTTVKVSGCGGGVEGSARGTHNKKKKKNVAALSLCGKESLCLQRPRLVGLGRRLGKECDALGILLF